jgi:hypothetical protein
MCHWCAFQGPGASLAPLRHLSSDGLCLGSSDVTGTSHFMETFNAPVGVIQKGGQTVTASGPFDFAKHRRPQFERPLSRARVAESDDGQMPVENLSDLLGRVSENSTGEIDSLIGDFERLRRKLQTDGERLQREIEEYRVMSQHVIEFTKVISKRAEKVRASVDRPTWVTQETE